MRNEKCCICCNSSRLAEVNYRLNEIIFVLEKCEDCGVAWLKQNFSLDEIKSAHAELYLGNNYKKKFNFPWVEFLVKFLLERQLSILKPFLVNGKSLLEIGCGRGTALRFFKNKGMDVRGIELDQRMKAMIADDLEVTFDSLDVLIDKNPLIKYDIIFMWHVFEHINDIPEILNNISMILKKNGLLCLAVPNFGSFQSSYFKDSWFHVDFPRHLWHFNDAGLQLLMRQFGLRLLKKDNGQFDMDVYGFIQSFLNKCGFPYNQLYDFLRSPSKTLCSSFKNFIQIFLTIVILPFLLIVSIFMYLFTKKQDRKGSIIHLYQKSEM